MIFLRFEIFGVICDYIVGVIIQNCDVSGVITPDLFINIMQHNYVICVLQQNTTKNDTNS